MTDLAAIGALNCAYFALVGVGVTYALLILVGGGLHDGGLHVDVPHADAAFGGDVTHGSVDVMHVSPVTLAGFVTAFGAFGLIATGLFDATGRQSLIWAALGGLLVGVVSHLVFIYVFVMPQGSSEVTRGDLVGSTADVITPIPEGRLGEIAVVAQGARFTMSARTTGPALARGTPVRIEDVVGSVATVAPIGSKDVQAHP